MHAVSLLVAKHDGFSVLPLGLLKPLSGTCQSWHLLTRVDKALSLEKGKAFLQETAVRKITRISPLELAQPEELGTV